MGIGSKIKRKFLPDRVERTINKAEDRLFSRSYYEAKLGRVPTRIIATGIGALAGGTTGALFGYGVGSGPNSLSGRLAFGAGIGRSISSIKPSLFSLSEGAQYGAALAFGTSLYGGSNANIPTDSLTGEALPALDPLTPAQIFPSALSKPRAQMRTLNQLSNPLLNEKRKKGLL